MLSVLEDRNICFYKFVQKPCAEPTPRWIVAVEYNDIVALIATFSGAINAQ